jgi:hypothetical protein
MKNTRVTALLSAVLFAAACSAGEKLIYHEIQTDANGQIVPWYSPNVGKSYDRVIKLCWNYWKNLPECFPGVKWYLLHRQVIVSSSNPVPTGGHDDGIGGDQIAMAMSSWNLLYAYSGDRSIVDNMVYMADYWLEHGFSDSNCAWPNLPYPCNPGQHNRWYDGDLVAGKGILQTDKAGSFGYELVGLHKITGDAKYLGAAVKIADTLAKNIKPGDKASSPLPYRVNAKNGAARDGYTSNWVSTIQLFDELVRLDKGDTAAYKSARTTLIEWLKKYPLDNNRWGPFFEDIPMWSNTQINAVTLAWYILEQQDKWGPMWKADARKILDWAEKTFTHRDWEKYGVIAIGEQSVYNAPGNSHTSRQASVELIYCEKTGDLSRKAAAIRQLNWATYMVDNDGKNRYPNNEVWLTDGYGDYVRHYLRAMAAWPELAPEDEDHLLKTSSVIRDVSYKAGEIRYTAFDATGCEVLRLTFKPGKVTVGGKAIDERKDAGDEGWVWQAMEKGGVLTVKRNKATEVVVAR